MSESKVAQLHDLYVYSTRKIKTALYTFYWFRYVTPGTKCDVYSKKIFNLQLHKNKKQSTKLLQLQHDCAIFGIYSNQSKKTFIALIYYNQYSIKWKIQFKVNFNLKDVISCYGISRSQQWMILLFEMKKNASIYYIIYSIKYLNQSKTFKSKMQYIKTWNKYYIKPLIVITPSNIFQSYQLGSCLKNNNVSMYNDLNSNIIWSLSLFIPDSYLRNILCIEPYKISLILHYSKWFWWIIVQKTTSLNFKLILIHQKNILTIIPFKSDVNNLLVPLKLILIPNYHIVLLLSKQKQIKKRKQSDFNSDCDSDNDDDDDDDIDMKYNNNNPDICYQCHVIKCNLYDLHKDSIHNAYNQMFNNQNDNNINNKYSDYKCVGTHKFQDNIDSFYFNVSDMTFKLCKMSNDIFKFTPQSSDKTIGWIQFKHQTYDLKKYLFWKIPKFFTKPLTTLTISLAKQLQKCYESHHDALSMFYSQFHATDSKFINDELINFEWKNNNNNDDDTKQFVVKLPSLSIDDDNDNVINGIILSCPYIRFTTSSINFTMCNPTYYMESLIIEYFQSLKQDLSNQALMIHTFNSKDLNNLGVLRLSMKQLTSMISKTQQMYFYKGLQENQLNEYLNKKDEMQYLGWIQYFNEFVEFFEKELIENTSKINTKDFYAILKSRLFSKYCSNHIPYPIVN